MVSPPSPTATAVAAPTTTPFKSTLSATAAPFYPSASWLPVEAVAYEYDDAYMSVHQIPDDELFDAACHPMTSEELLELEQMDEINAMLADLELMETHNELYQEHQKVRASSSSDVADAELRSLAKKQTKHVDYVKHASAPRFPKKSASYHMKKNMFAPIQQPRSVK